MGQTRADDMQGRGVGAALPVSVGAKGASVPLGELLLAGGVVNALDRAFAELIQRLAGTEATAVFLGAALASQYTGRGHVCLDLAAVAGQVLVAGAGDAAPVICPSLNAWRQSLEQSGVVGQPGTYRPLILDARHRLYLYRYWGYENEVADTLQQKGAEEATDVEEELLRAGLERHFAVPAGVQSNSQRLAAWTAVKRRLCVISGGPGTGKTTTVAKILVLLQEQALRPGPRAAGALRIALTAPTGKAGGRLEEAISAVVASLQGCDAVKALMPTEAQTLHRLLGARPGSPEFRHNARNPLNFDVVVVDEASMVDLALMAKLLRALPREARLILLGDKDQLASVEAGAVLGDICGAGVTWGDKDVAARAHGPAARAADSTSAPAAAVVRPSPGLAACIVELRENFRFGPESGIGALSERVREGDGSSAMAILCDSRFSDVAWLDLPPPEGLGVLLRPVVVPWFRRVRSALDGVSRWGAFERFRILCALRQGPYGAGAVNDRVERMLAGEGGVERGVWYACRPVMVVRNDYGLKLFNGDVGLILPADPAHEQATLPAPATQAALHGGSGRSIGQGDGVWRAWFPGPGGDFRSFPTARLPAHETVFAMTVHKSQGSEFDDVLLILPDRPSPVLTRELVYTAVTRARRSVTVCGCADVFKTAVARRVERSSGLRDALWGA